MSLPGVTTIINDRFISVSRYDRIPTELNFIEVSFTLNTATGEVIQATPNNPSINANQQPMYDELKWG